LGNLAATLLAHGAGWTVRDVVCTAGPEDRPYEEQHDAFTIAVVLEGSFQYRSTGVSELMSPGSLLLGNHGQCFECAHEHGVGDRCVSFEYSPAFFEAASLERRFPVARIPPLRALAPRIGAAQLGTQLPSRLNLEELAIDLAGDVLDVLTDVRDLRAIVTPADERRISTVVRYINAHMGLPLPLDHLADVARMSRFHFVRVFRRVTGVTPHQYVLRARLRAAAMQLAASADPIVEVAFGVGFGDLSNFSTAFRTEFGVSPARYRRAAR
jgi:AraC family transcriptional regulator